MSMSASVRDALKDVHKKCKTRKEHEKMLAAVKKDGAVLRRASEDQKADRDIVLAAVQNYSFSFYYQFTSKRFHLH